MGTLRPFGERPLPVRPSRPPAPLPDSTLSLAPLLTDIRNITSINYDRYYKSCQGGL